MTQRNLYEATPRGPLVAAKRSRLHRSWLPWLAALNWVLIADHFKRADVDIDVPVAAAAAGVSILVVASVAIREAVRRVVTASTGGRVDAGALWPIGSQTGDGTPPLIRTEVRGAVAAALTSIALAALFGALNVTGTARAITDVLVRFNAALAVFNLIPAAPLDGGLILRSVLRARGRSFADATATAARAGLIFAGMVVATGIARVITGDEPGGIGLSVAGLITGAAARAHSRSTPVVGTVTLRTALAGVPLGLAMLVAVAALYHPPLSLAYPGTPFDVSADIELVGRAAPPIRGRYVAPSVVVQEPTALHAFVSLFRRGHYLVRRDSLRPLVEDRFLPAGDATGLFRLSRDYAVVAAATAVGIPVELHGTGVRVLAAGPGPRDAGFVPGDAIVAVDGKPVDRIEQLQEIVIARPVGTTFALTVERAGLRVKHALRSLANERSGNVPYLDMLGETRDFRFTLPFEIRYRSEGGLGPSAGLAYALAIADLLDPRDLARGRTIAATGRVGLTGGALPIIGAIAKQWSALDAGAGLFVVHTADADSLRDPVLPVAGVNDVREAIERLLAF